MSNFKIGDRVRILAEPDIFGEIIFGPFRNHKGFYVFIVNIEEYLQTDNPGIKVDSLCIPDVFIQIVGKPLKVKDEIYIDDKRCTGVIERIQGHEAIVNLTNVAHTGSGIVFRRVVVLLSSCKRIRDNS